MGADQVDWKLIARRFDAASAVMLHQEKPGLYGNEFHAEAIRRAITGAARDLAGHMIEGHRDVGLTPTTEARQATERAVATWKFNADIIRHSVNGNSLPSRYRREGALWAADLLSPAAPADSNRAQEDRQS